MGKNIKRIVLGQENSCERLPYSFAFFLGGEVKHAQGHFCHPFRDHFLKVIHLLLMWLTHPAIKPAILTSNQIDPVYRLAHNLSLLLSSPRKNLSDFLLLLIVGVAGVYHQRIALGCLFRKYLHEGDSVNDTLLCQLFDLWVGMQDRAVEHEAINYDKIW